jgi:hypothetical protein
VLSTSHHYVDPTVEAERDFLESLIREDFEHCYPDDTIEQQRRRASHSRYDKGLLRDWMGLAAARAGTFSARMRPIRSTGVSLDPTHRLFQRLLAGTRVGLS